MPCRMWNMMSVLHKKFMHSNCITQSIHAQRNFILIRIQVGRTQLSNLFVSAEAPERPSSSVFSITIYSPLGKSVMVDIAG